MTIEQMKAKLLEWNPLWDVDRFTDQQIVAIYNKERNKIVQAIFESHTRPVTYARAVSGHDNGSTQ